MSDEPTPVELFALLEQPRAILLGLLRERRAREAELVGRAALIRVVLEGDRLHELITILGIDVMIAEAAQRHDLNGLLRPVVSTLALTGRLDEPATVRFRERSLRPVNAEEVIWLATTARTLEPWQSEARLYRAYLDQGPLALQSCPHGRRSIFGACATPPCPETLE